MDLAKQPQKPFNGNINAVHFLMENLFARMVILVDTGAIEKGLWPPVSDLGNNIKDMTQTRSEPQVLH